MKTIKQLREEIEFNSEGIIPEPIHFKYINNTSLFEGVGPINHHSKWFKTKDNTHIGRTLESISKKISAHHDLPEDESNSIDKYTSYSRNLNKGLLRKQISKTAKKTRDRLNKIISKYPLKHELHSYSGVSFDPRKHVKKGIMHSPAFMSATHDKYVAHSYAEDYTKKSGNMHIIHFHLKKGDKALHVNKYSHFPEEHETLIAPSKLKYHGTDSYKLHDDNSVHIHHMSIAK